MAANKAAKPKKDTPTESTREFPSAFSLFEPSWEAFKVNFGTFLLLFILLLASIAAAVILILLIAAAFKDNHVLMIPLISLSVLALVGFCVLLAPTAVYVQLKSARGDKVETDAALQEGKKYFWRFWGLSILVSLIVVVGLILFIIPGLFMIKRYLLAPYFLVDKDLSISDAMSASAEAGKRFAGAIWGILGVEVVISLASVIPFIGSIINLVLSIAYYCAPAVRYEQIKATS